MRESQKLSLSDAWMLLRLSSYPRVAFEKRLAELNGTGVTEFGRELALRIIKEDNSAERLTSREYTLLKRYLALLNRAKARG